MNRFPGKLALLQRVLPIYRAPFFDLLASACDGGMSLFTGLPRPIEGITTTDKLQVAKYTLGKNVHLFGGKFYLCYQLGLIPWLQKTNPDALIVEANPRYLSTPVAVKWMHKRNKPVIGWGLGAPPPLSPPHFRGKWGGMRGGGMICPRHPTTSPKIGRITGSRHLTKRHSLPSPNLNSRRLKRLHRRVQSLHP